MRLPVPARGWGICMGSVSLRRGGVPCETSVSVYGAYFWLRNGVIDLAPCAAISWGTRPVFVALAHVAWRAEELDIGQDMSAAAGDRHDVVEVEVVNDAVRAIDAPVALPLQNGDQIPDGEQYSLTVEITASGIAQDIGDGGTTLHGGQPPRHPEMVGLGADAGNVCHV